MLFFIVIDRYIAACDEVKKLKTVVQQERTIIIQLQQNISEKESENEDLKKAIKMKNEENDKLMKRYTALIICEQNSYI